MNKAVRVIYALARADFLERVRRYSFLTTLALALYFGYLATIGKIVLNVDNMRGVANSAWVGGLFALVGSLFLTLAGFYFVKNTVQRDRETGVGQILAATPISKFRYMLAKLLSNFVVLSAMIAVLAVSAFAMQLYAGEDRHIRLWPLLSPFFLIALPAMALVASLALLFEAIPFLRGGFGNVFYFFVWVFGLSLPVATNHSGFDWTGVTFVQQSMRAYSQQSQGLENFSFSLDVGGIPVPTKTFQWDGITWTTNAILARLMWFAVAFAFVAIAAAIFDRFNPAIAGGGSPSRKSAAASVALTDTTDLPFSLLATSSSRAILSPLAASSVHLRFAAMLLAEVRLLVNAKKWWFYFVAAGLAIASCVVPDPAARGMVLAVAWLWPVLLWSQMGVRESRDGTGPVLFSTPHPLARQLPAVWLAGVFLALATGSGFALRLLLNADLHGLFAWIVGALFIPTAALALGIWSASAKPFEILFTLLWYVGPMHATPALDFMGSAPATAHTQFPLIYLALTCVFAAAAIFGRKHQLG